MNNINTMNTQGKTESNKELKTTNAVIAKV